MRGPKPIPTAIKALRGNPSRRPLNRKEPLPPEGEFSCPQHLNAAARREWHRILPMLKAMGTAKPVDRSVVAIYCQAYGRWVEVERKLKDKGPLYATKAGNVIQSPYLGIAHREEEIMLKAGAELGIGAATRSRINTEKQDGKNDPMELLLSGDRTN